MTMMASEPRSAAIEKRIDRTVTTSIGMTASRGMVIQSLDQAMEFAKVMAISEQAVPKHLRGNPGACLAIAIQGYEWSINPFALANKSYVVNDRLAYESALYHAVVQRRAPIKGRIKSQYAGEGASRTCKVWAVLDDGSDETVEYTSPQFAAIPVKNSPLWKSDPDQQLFYYSVRAFARRHFPDVMMGIYTVDEMIDQPTVVAESPAKSRVDALAAKIGVAPHPTDEQLTVEVDAEAASNAQAQDSHAGETIDSETGEVSAEVATTPENVEPVQQTLAEPKTFLTHDELVRHLNEAAMTLGRPESSIHAGLAASVPAGKENKTTPARRREIWREYVGGTGAWAAK